MPGKKFTMPHHIIGRVASMAVFALGVAYAIVTFLGFLSLESPQDPIGNPYFAIMELLILLIAPLMVISLTAVHAYARSDDKIYSLIALIFMILTAGITSSVHFLILTVSPHVDVSANSWGASMFIFEWPSVVYALDILAWDWFFALSMLFAAPVFRGGGLVKVVRSLFVISGILSLAGLIGVLLSDMQIRNIGIIGYGVAAPVAFLLLAIIFGRH